MRLQTCPPLRAHTLSPEGVWTVEWSYDRPGEAMWARPPRGWSWVNCPGQLLAEESLRRVLRDTAWGLVRRDAEGFCLAFPWSEKSPFPIPPLFCLCRVSELEGERYTVFRFSRRGWAEPPHNLPEAGDNTSGT